MALVSSFELLFEPIIPVLAQNTPNAPKIDPPPAPDPLVIQSFFAFITNFDSLATAKFTLQFTATVNSTLDPSQTFGLFDIDNTNFLAEFRTTPATTPGATSASAIFAFNDLQLAPQTTGLFLLQPDVNFLISQLPTKNGKPDLQAANAGLRGYVEVLPDQASDMLPPPLLISPQTRGTFIDPNTGQVLAEEAYPLPTPTGANLFSF